MGLKEILENNDLKQKNYMKNLTVIIECLVFSNRILIIFNYK